MKKFKAWCPDGRDEPDDFNVSGYDPEWVACELAAKRYSGNDYPEEQEIHVLDEDGTLHVFTVFAEPDVNFSARRKVTT